MGYLKKVGYDVYKTRGGLRHGRDRYDHDGRKPKFQVGSRHATDRIVLAGPRYELLIRELIRHR